MWDTGGALGQKQKGHETTPSLLAGLGVLLGRMARGLAQNSRSCGITSVERLEVSRRGRDCESQARMMGAQARPGMSQALSRPLQSPLRRDAAREGEKGACHAERCCFARAGSAERPGCLPGSQFPRVTARGRALPGSAGAAQSPLLPFSSAARPPDKMSGSLSGCTKQNQPFRRELAGISPSLRAGSRAHVCF